MKASNYELWLKACEEFHTELYPLENKNEIILYQSKTVYMVNHFNYYRVAYRIWDIPNDKDVYAGLDYRQAYLHWQQYIEKTRSVVHEI